ncbi:PepSY domain-containing protein [Paraherbaspirillum soli]|uniref:PepSY domain-containing protein n=1 Tax=Paraherbaspirillum soli TaxID=631222 RepID=A0ABW0MB45_9BURK
MFKKIWFQLHWLLGITAGSVLMVVGVSGALLSFSDEFLDLFNPAVMHVAPRAAALLTPAELLARLQVSEPDMRVVSVRVSREADASARIMLAPPPGVRRGETRFVDPYTGALLARLKGNDFFQFVERLHRWLLASSELGKVLTGSATLCLLVLALSGLYLRWPRRPLAWRNWIKLDFGLSGRSLLWNLHAVLGTWVLLVYLLFSLTGMYFAFGWFKQAADFLAGQSAPQGAPKKLAKAAPRPSVPTDLTLTWSVFLRETGGAYSSAQLRLPEQLGQPVQINYLDPDPAHEQARNRMSVQPSSGQVALHERYADKTAAGRLLASVYPLHVGTYFGWPGRIVMMLAGGGLPLFGISGWMLYLDRRRKQRRVLAERAQLGSSAAAHDRVQDTILVAFASQSGQSERLALRTAAALQAAEMPVAVQSLAQLVPERLRYYQRVLFVVSTFGDGDPPDSARRFARQLAQQAGSGLGHMQYAVLALGERHYQRFCGFAHSLVQCLSGQGARVLFPMIELDHGNPAAAAAALKQWQQALGGLAGIADGQLAASMQEQVSYSAWRLSERRCLNPGSQGGAMFHLEFEAADRSTPAWLSGGLVKIVPRHAPEHSLPTSGDHSPPPLPAARRYSIASIPAAGRMHLLVRQVRHAHGLGLASGWLTERMPLGSVIEMRLLPNPGFELAAGDAPCIFIGNGSGLAGLRGHLQARVRNGHRRNWLLFGERNRTHDFHYRDEIERWQADGFLERVDLAFSRDQAERIYVQDKLRTPAAAAALRAWVDDGALIYVCGSLDGMAAGVDAALADILGSAMLDDLTAAGRYRRDIY